MFLCGWMVLLLVALSLIKDAKGNNFMSALCERVALVYTNG